MSKVTLAAQRRFQAWFFGPHLWTADLVLSACDSLAAATITWRLGAQPICDLLQKDGTALYGAVLAAATALLGFAVAAITIVSGLVTADVFRALRSGEHYESFWKAFTWTVRALGITSFVSFIAIFVNKYNPAQLYLCAVVFWMASISGWSLIRSGMTLEALLSVVREDQRRKSADTRLETHYPSVDVQ